MAYTVIATAVATPDTAPTNITGADLLVFLVCGISAGTPTDDLGNIWNSLTLQTGYYGQDFGFWYAWPAVTGTGIFHSSGLFPSGVLIALNTGGVLSDPFDVENGTITGIPPAIGASLTPTQNNEIVIAGFGSQQIDPTTVNSGMTIAGSVDTTGGNFGTTMAYIIQTTAGTVQPTFTPSGWNDAVSGGINVIASFKSTGGGGVTNPSRLSLLGVG